MILLRNLCQARGKHKLPLEYAKLEWTTTSADVSFAGLVVISALGRPTDQTGGRLVVLNELRTPTSLVAKLIMFADCSLCGWFANKFVVNVLPVAP